MKRIFLLLIFTHLIFYSLIAENLFSIDYNFKTGGLNKIACLSDSSGMNYIIPSDCSQFKWQTPEQGWGLGKLLIDNMPFSWNQPDSAYPLIDKKLTFVYKVNDITVSVIRCLENDDSFSEQYIFRNNTLQTKALSNIYIFTPFNDNLAKYSKDVEKCCHAHIWPGGNSAYVNAVKMAGKPLNLGLIVIEGSIVGYEVSNRSLITGSSNIRGTIALKMEDVQLEPNQGYSLKWKLSWNKGWKEFSDIRTHYGSVIGKAERYIVQSKDTICATFYVPESYKYISCYANNDPVNHSIKNNTVQLKFVPKSLGDVKITIKYNDLSTWINVFVVSSIPELIEKRVSFIVDNQQLKDKKDPRYGAFMVYDNETNKIYLNDDKRSSFDTNEGAERLAMGVLCARYQQKHPQRERLLSLLDYYSFVRNKLQTPDYKVYSDVLHTSRNRCYNYGWVFEFYVELYKATRNKQHILDAYNTLRRFFQDFGYNFIIFRIPVNESISALKDAGLNVEAAILLDDFKKYAKTIIDNGISYDKSLTEINFAIGGISANVMFLAEMFQLTNNDIYKDNIQKQLELIHRFEGFQPDHHLYQIGIRHWDGFWFGKRSTWGDTMPQWLTSLSGYANYLYYQITGDTSYLKNAEMISLNNLSLFKEDGSARCTYLYPDRINGIPGKFYDPFANDQDWALVYYTLINEDW